MRQDIFSEVLNYIKNRCFCSVQCSNNSRPVRPEQVVPKLPDGTGIHNDDHNQVDAVRIYWTFKELTNTGATGAPKKVTAEKGERIMQLLEMVLTSFINEMESNNWKYGQGQGQ
jgi:creatinine amidohydrolase/Fe(II)-dependent formamide hydrolase-like protein